MGIDRKVLLVRHTYGSAKDRILLPGGYVLENELAATAIEREIYEETGVQTKAESLIAMQYKPEQWCSVFVMKYIFFGCHKHADFSKNRFYET